MTLTHSLASLATVQEPSTMAFLLLLLFFVSAVLLLHTQRSRRSDRKAQTVTYPPGLKPYPLLGHLPKFLANRHRILDWMTELLETQPTCTVVFHRLGGVRGVVTANPANVEHFLRTNFDNYPKGARFTSLLHDFLGQGIFNSDGEQWRTQRKAASYEFRMRSLRAFLMHCVHRELHARLLPLLRRAAAAGRAVDLQDVLERFAFDNICMIAFGHDPCQLLDDDKGDDASPQDDEAARSSFTDAFRDAANLSAGRFRSAVPSFWKVKKALDVGSERRLRLSIAMVHGFADSIIRSRREELSAGHEKHDLLSRFMASKEGSYSEETLRDIVISFLLAGRETTSSALSWFFWLLSSRPDVERRIREEVAAVRARRQHNTGDHVGFDLEELREMHYVHAAITESMRLYPPVPVDIFEAQADDVLPDDTVVRAGWFVEYNSYAMGRMEAVWGTDAREYRPDRWLDPAAGGEFRPESPFRYVTFHAGPRQCLGKEMAYIQMKSIVASMLEEFHMAMVDGAYRPQQLASLALRMKDGLPVRVKARANQQGAVMSG